MEWWLIVGVGVVVLWVLIRRATRTQQQSQAVSWQPPANALMLAEGFNVETVGESHYQEALERLCGGRTPDGAHHPCLALLVPEASNPFDPNAIRIEIEDQLVGYLNRGAAKAYRPIAQQLAEKGQVAMVTAMIVGGWERDHDNRGSFGVRLNFAPPGEGA